MKRILIEKTAGFAVLSMCLLAFASVMIAQDFRGTITGQVTDPNGAVVPNATVIIRNVDTNSGSTVPTE